MLKAGKCESQTFGTFERCFKPLSVWADYAQTVGGSAFPGGHYIPEESPDLLLRELDAFFN